MRSSLGARNEARKSADPSDLMRWRYAPSTEPYRASCDPASASRCSRRRTPHREPSLPSTSSRCDVWSTAGGPHPDSVTSLRAALFSENDLQLAPAASFGEDEANWERPDTLAEEGRSSPGEGWTWHQPERVISGPSWGGNLEILHWNLAVGRWIRPSEDYSGCVLLLETSEEMPASEEVFRMMRNMGERGLLAQFSAVLFGRAKAAHLGVPAEAGERARFRAEQRAAVLRAFAAYNPEAMVVFDVDLGHTDPQWVVPYGGAITVDGPARTITAHYRSGPVD